MKVRNRIEQPVESVSRWLRRVLIGQVSVTAEQKQQIAEQDAALQRNVEQSWINWNDERGAAEPNEEVVGIACSGGGLRSAAFNLGALQALQQEGVLDHAAWLSAVSGGSYIAAAHYLVQNAFDADDADDATSPGAEEHGSPGPGERASSDGAAADGESTKNPYQQSFEDTPAFELGSPEERWLRTHSSYLADSLRVKLRLAGHVLFGSMLILGVVALIIAVVALISGVAGAALFPALRRSTTGLGMIAPNGWTTFGLVLLAAGTACGFLAVGTRWGETKGRPLQRTGTSLAVAAFVTLTCSFGLPWLIVALRDVLTPAAGANAQQLSRVLTALGAIGLPPLLMTAFGMLLRGAGNIEPEVRSRILRRVLPKLPTVVAAIAGPLLFLSLFLFLYNWATLVPARSALIAWFSVILGLIAIAVIFDPTTASLHTFYKRRLATAFDAIRIQGPDRDGKFDEAAQRDYSQLTQLSHSGVKDYPKLVVGAAANVSDKGATPTGRNAVPFSFSTDWVGGSQIGWIRTTELEELMGEPRRRDMTLLAAVAMSGAAVSPSMGKMSRPSYRVLLTLVNARLGVWLPNPRHSRTPAAVGPKAVKLAKSHNGQAPGPAVPSKRPRLAWLLRELMGWTSIDARRIYVTDGGHYENLGLIELLRRKCTVIYCFDASGDKPDSFTTLAQTLALARTELGVDIPADPATLRSEMQPLRTNGRPQAKQSHFVIPFQYPADARVAGHSLDKGAETKGVLVYVKCRVTATAPWDVRALYERDEGFPDHSTADQLYTDERLEAYRALGDHLALEAFTAVRTGDSTATNGHRVRSRTATR